MVQKNNAFAEKPPGLLGQDMLLLQLDIGENMSLIKVIVDENRPHCPGGLHRVY